MLTIYHNSRCRKSRAGLAYLREKGVEHEVRLYLNDSLTLEDMQRILMKMNVEAIELVRKQEDQFKKELKGRNFTEDEWIRIILENPKLLQRPIVEAKYKAVLGDPPENIEALIQPNG